MAYRSLLQTTQPILQEDVNGNPLSAIFGRPIVIDESRSAIAATNKAILFGDLKAGYTARKAGDFGIKPLSELLAPKNETGFVLLRSQISDRERNVRVSIIS